MSNGEKFREKEVYREKIVEMLEKIDNLSIINYIYIIIKDIVKERGD